MHDSSFRVRSRLWAAGAALAALTFAVGPASAASIERASIFPVVNQFLGPAVNSIPGYSIYANGVSDFWQTSASQTVNFVAFVFPGKQVTQDITFTVLPPAGDTPVYTYTFKAQSIGVVGTWFTVGASGDYSKAGVYTVEVTADGAEIGSIPIVFTAPTGAH
jgi:hypothetical protein